MALQYLNAVEVGLENSNGTYQYSFGQRYARKLIWVWLVKVVGWQDIEKSGSYYDNPQLTGTDGATDAVDPTKFTSATGGFTDALEQSYLVVHPTAAPVATGGFSDQTRNGFYKINGVEDGNTLYVDQWRGVHTDGLPLSESGLTFSIYRFRDASTQIPRLNDYYVVRGTGTNSNEFDLYVPETTGNNYNPWRHQLSPFADWVTGAPGSFVPTSRLCDQEDYGNDSTLDRCVLMGIADTNHFFVFMRGYNETRTLPTDEPRVWYCGEIEAFHAADDPRPFVDIFGEVNGSNYNVLEIIDSRCRMLSADDTTALTSSVGFISHHDYSASNMLTGATRARSRFSGRFVQTPLMIFEEASGHAEVRGTLKNVHMGHDDGLPNALRVYPFGTNLDKLKISNIVMDWNGSKVLDNIF